MSRRRSENVGWGSLCKTLNRARREEDAKHKPDDEEGEFPYWRFKRNKPAHPNSTRFEQEGRVPPRDEEGTWT